MADGVGVSVGAGVGVSDEGPSLHATTAVAMRAANRPLEMARGTTFLSPLPSICSETSWPWPFW